ncbi:MAG: efflux RND transporter permease subunit [Candidatus Cloacimonetes bacterium]|nr:efflux RND transporter permease subunit [Candidatus Cloacimonadota bacterium]
MSILRNAILNPVSMSVFVLLLVLFGFVGLLSLPMQLTPDIEVPKITVMTLWPGATPYEIEKDVIEPQENVLKSLRGLERVDSTSRDSVGTITLRFSLNTNLDDALLRVSNKIGEVPRYPDNVQKPIISSSGSAGEPVIWSVIKVRDDVDQDIAWYRTYFDNEIQSELERIEGVGGLFVSGGRQMQVDVILNPEKLASFSMGIEEVLKRFSEVNQNLSAGLLSMDKKNYRVRTLTRFENLTDPLSIVMRDDGVNRVYLRDIAEVKMGLAPLTVSVIQNDRDVIVVGFRKVQGANVVEMTRKVRQRVEELNQTLLKDKGLEMKIVFDQLGYISGSIFGVRDNILMGGFLAVCILFLFLKSVRSTFTIALAIPISGIGTFLFLWLSGRNLNVVSLAGISFAVGMLVDNAIVVLENIDRHRKMGKSPFDACYDGVAEVVGAVMASTMTTVAVFVPVIFMQEEAGQLFRDIAIAISSAISLSFLVSVFVIPSVMHLLYQRAEVNLNRKLPTDRIGEFFSTVILGISQATLKSGWSRLITIVFMVSLSLGTVWVLMPKSEYLPQGNMNFVLGIVIPPPGYTADKNHERGKLIFEQMKPYMGGDMSVPQMDDLFYVGSDEMNIFGGTATNDDSVKALLPVFNMVMNSIPDVFGFAFQPSIFASDMGEGRAVEVLISSGDMGKNLALAGQFFGQIMGLIPGAQVMSSPSLEMTYPEANILPNRDTVIANGFSEYELGLWVDILMEGRKISEYSPEGMKKIDIVVRADKEPLVAPENILGTQIASSSGKLVRLEEVAGLTYGSGLTQIDRRDGRRSMRLIVTPPDSMPIEEAMEILDTKLLAPAREAGQLEGMFVGLGGQADKLTQTKDAMKWQLLLAVLITYLLLSSLMESYFFSLIIMVSVPLAAGGGFVGLRLVDKFIAPQSFDIVSMLGFIILIGTVVNNAILIVYQSLQNVREAKMDGMPAITLAVKTRLRPIFASTLTSVLGLAPMVFATGAGSELYRGIGSVVLGGLMLSTVFSVLVIPAILGFTIHSEVRRVKRKSALVNQF